MATLSCSEQGGCSGTCPGCTCAKAEERERLSRLSRQLAGFAALCSSKERDGKVVIDGELASLLESVKSSVLAIQKNASSAETDAELVSILKSRGNGIIHRVFLKDSR